MKQAEKISDAKKTEIILKELMSKYERNGRSNVIFPELRLGSGYSDIAQRRIDMFMISSEKGNYTTAFEIKVSRGDFLRDIKDEAKQRGARLYSSNFYYVAPKGMLNPEEIPMWAGLMEYDFESKQFNTRIVAPLQSRNTPSWSLVCSLVRRVNEKVYSDKIYELNNEAEYFCKECEEMLGILQSIRIGRYKDNPDDLKFLLDMRDMQKTNTLKIMIKHRRGDNDNTTGI